MFQTRNWFLAAVLTMSLTLGWQAWSSGQQAATSKAQAVAADPNRFVFEVVQSYDAKYLGDTPGHIGRSGGLENRRPRVALDDPVFRGDEKVGRVTALDWNRTRGSLEVEFDPVDHARINVGDEVWLALDGKPAVKGQ
jgi:hypothetical protein